MAEIRPLRALHYAPGVPLGDVVAPPYDVIDDERREALAQRSEHNVVHVDLPRGRDPYGDAAATFDRWRRDGVLVRDDEPAFWVLSQEFTGPDGQRRVRSGFFAAVRVEDYGAGRIRPHERTHPGPKEDRLRLQRATRANLSPIFSLFGDAGGRTWAALRTATAEPPFGETVDDDGTVNRLWRVGDPGAVDAVTRALAGVELLIADGHHRYETARVYAQEQGTDEASWVLMCLVALEDPGLTVFPTHRLVRGRGLEAYERLAGTLRERFTIEEATLDDLAPRHAGGPPAFGYLDSHFRRPFHITLSSDGRDTGLEGPLRDLDAAVLETLLLKGPLGLSDDDISHLRDFGYARDARQAIELVTTGEYDVAFLLRPTPVEQVRAIAGAGQSMPPKSTYFHPKVPTGLLFNPLADRDTIGA